MADDKLIPDLIVKVFDHHKTHARFEESQRTLFVAAYFTVTGILATGIINAFTERGAFIAGASKPLTIVVFIHLALGIFIALAVAKTSGEFRRHFNQSEKLLKSVSEQYKENALSLILKSAELETAGHQTTSYKNKLVQFLSVAAAYNYIMSLFIAADISVLTLLFFAPSTWLFCLILSVTFLLAALVQHIYIRFIERR